MRVPSTVLVKAPAEPSADPVVRDPAGRQLAAACVAGDPAARRQLQELLWPLIEDLVRVTGRRDAPEPGEVLAYALEDDRVYRRLRTFAGRVSLKSYLLKYVLRHLVLQLISHRDRRAIRTVPFDDLSAAEELSSQDAQTLDPAPTADAQTARDIFSRLSAERRVLLKLLHLEDFDLDEDERELLARRGDRSLAEIDAAIERARAAIRSREAARRARIDRAALVARSIQLHEQRLAQMDERLHAAGNDPSLATRCVAERAAIEAKLAWRRRQQHALLDESRRAPVTLPYREIAELMNMPIGTVTSELTRVRRTLRRLLAPATDEKELA